MTRVYGSLLALAALVLLCSPSPAAAQLDKAGVVTTLQGTATVVRATTKESLPLRFKDDVFVRDRITTGDNSVARILLGGKAVVTVRERSVLTITEVPGGSTVDIAIGKVALAVVKERMKPGETIDIRTPNAVAGIRGTVVITEVEQATAQADPVTDASFTSTFTVLTGVVQVSPLDSQTRRPTGVGVILNALQNTRRTGRTQLRPPQTLTKEAAQRLSTDYKLKVTEAPGAEATNASLAKNQIQQAITQVNAIQSATPPRPTLPVVGTTGVGDTTGPPPPVVAPPPVVSPPPVRLPPVVAPPPVVRPPSVDFQQKARENAKNARRRSRD